MYVAPVATAAVADLKGAEGSGAQALGGVASEASSEWIAVA
jgi:hypothetical protein